MIYTADHIIKTIGSALNIQTQSPIKNTSLCDWPTYHTRQIKAEDWEIYRGRVVLHHLHLPSTSLHKSTRYIVTPVAESHIQHIAQRAIAAPTDSNEG
jgi:hypothetical protein